MGGRGYIRASLCEKRGDASLVVESNGRLEVYTSLPYFELKQAEQDAVEDAH